MEERCCPAYGPVRDKGGFTLIELAMLILIVGVLAAAVLMSNPLSGMKTDGAARKLKADIRYVRKLSISTQSRAALSMNATGYTVFSDIVSSALANSTGEACSTDPAGKFVVSYAAPRCSFLSGVTLTAFPPTLAFDTLGRPVDAAGVPLATQTITVSGTTSLTVQADTGRVN